MNCRLYFYDLEDSLTEWIEKRILDGDADNYVWDRLDSMDAPEL